MIVSPKHSRQFGQLVQTNLPARLKDVSWTQLIGPGGLDMIHINLNEADLALIESCENTKKKVRNAAYFKKATRKILDGVEFTFLEHFGNSDWKFQIQINPRWTVSYTQLCKILSLIAGKEIQSTDHEIHRADLSGILSSNHFTIDDLFEGFYLSGKWLGGIGYDTRLATKAKRLDGKSESYKEVDVDIELGWKTGFYFGKRPHRASCYLRHEGGKSNGPLEINLELQLSGKKLEKLGIHEIQDLPKLFHINPFETVSLVDTRTIPKNYSNRKLERMKMLKKAAQQNGFYVVRARTNHVSGQFESRYGDAFPHLELSRERHRIDALLLESLRGGMAQWFAKDLPKGKKIIVQDSWGLSVNSSSWRLPKPNLSKRELKNPSP